jgi:hypothetical protein
VKQQKPVDGLQQAWTTLGEALPLAAKTLAELLGAQDERVRLRASLAILNRAGITEAQPTEPLLALAKVGGLGNSARGESG